MTELEKELAQLKGQWFDLEMEQRRLIGLKQQVETRIQEVFKEVQNNSVQPEIK